MRSGLQLGEAAGAVSVHQRTVQVWVSWYREGGMEEVVAHEMGGRGQLRITALEGLSVAAGCVGKAPVRAWTAVRGCGRLSASFS